jgi:hypothetical protein
MTRFHLSLILAPALSVLATAQTGPLVGYTTNPGAPAQAILRQDLCNPPTVVCPNALPPLPDPHAGGFARDPHRGLLWHTNGNRLQSLDPSASATACRPLCTMPNMLVLGPTSLAGGLTYDTARRSLLQVESIPGAAAIVEYVFSAGADCPQGTLACRFTLPAVDHLSGAIALDRKRNIVYVAASTFSGPVVPQNRILLIDRGRCEIRCSLPLQTCLTGTIGPIRAMAYDECADVLYVSDGRQTSVQDVVWGTAVCPTLRPLSCCPLGAPSGMLWADFDLEPIAPRILGSSCTLRPCANCPSMALGTVGDAVVGNGSWAFTISQAPAGATGFVIFNFGACQPIPFGCGQVLPVLPAFVRGPVALGGIGACDGNGVFPTPIPNDFNLCDALLCAQGVVLCPGGGFGLTNGLVIPIGS